jgi:hypothetical protein
MVQLMASGGVRVLGGYCIRNRGLDGFRSGSAHGRRERLDVGTANAAAIRAAEILIARWQVRGSLSRT